MKIDEGRLTSSREESEESDYEEEEFFYQKEMKKIKMEEQLDEEQLLEDEEQNQPTLEQEEHKDQHIPKSRFQKNNPLDQIIGDKDVGIGTKKILSEINEKVHFSLLSTTEPGIFREENTDEQWVKEVEE